LLQNDLFPIEDYHPEYREIIQNSVKEKKKENQPKTFKVKKYSLKNKYFL
jgi:hypothetical protein